MRWLIGIAIAAALAGGAFWHFAGNGRSGIANGAPAPNTAPAAIMVEARPVASSAIRRQIEAVGSLRSNEAVILRPEIAGRITEILFDEGQKVRKGMALIKLDAAIARAQLEQARSSVVLSRANHERAEDLFRRGAGTQRARDEAVAKLQSDEASLSLAQATLDKSTLVAPFDAVIGLRRVSIGDYVNPGQDLVNLENTDSLKVDFRIPEIYSMQIKVNQSVQIRLDAIPDRTYEGKVFAIDPAYDPNGRAIILRARLANTDGLMHPGMFARVTLLIEERESAIVVPETALVPIGQEQFVFRVVDSKAVLTKVTIGQRRRGQVEIVGGLQSEAIIVIEGALKLRDGTAVRMAASPKAI